MHLRPVSPALAVSPPSGRPGHAVGGTILTAATDPWSRLMLAAQAGNGGAYGRLLEDVASWLRRYFQRRLPPADVEDAVQETLLAIHRRRHTYDAHYPFAPWLAAIARRKWVDQLRLSARLPTEEIPGNAASADHEAAVTSASVLTSLMGELRPAQARAIELVKLRGYSIEEASRKTGQSVSAVKVKLHRGLARLTAMIVKNNDVE